MWFIQLSPKTLEVIGSACINLSAGSILTGVIYPFVSYIFNTNTNTNIVKVLLNSVDIFILISIIVFFSLCLGILLLESSARQEIILKREGQNG